MKIHSVKVENILRVKFAEIEFKDDVVVIGGENWQGKSSVANAIAMAFGGKRAVPVKPVRDGAEEGTIEIQLEGDLLLKVTIQPDRSTKIELSDANGRVRTPQSKLDEFNYHYGWYPQDFLTLEPKEKVTRLMSLIGLDFAQIDAEHAILWEKRTNLGRQLKVDEERLELLPEYSGVPDEEQTATDLLKQQEAISATERRKAGYAADVARLKSAKAQYVTKVEASAASIATLEARIEALRKEAITLKAQIKDIEASTIKIEGEARDLDKLIADAELVEQSVIVADIEPVRKAIAEIDSTNAKVRANKKRAEMLAGILELRDAQALLSEKIAAIQEARKAAIRGAKFPIEGLGFDETGVTYKGQPLEQSSIAEQWLVATSIGFAMKPELKLVYIRDGSLMSASTRKMVYDITREQGGQLLIEVVGETKDTTVIMEDGVSYPVGSIAPVEA